MVIPLHQSTHRLWHLQFFILYEIPPGFFFFFFDVNVSALRLPALPLKSARNMTDLWSHIPPFLLFPVTLLSFQLTMTSSKSCAIYSTVFQTNCGKIVDSGVFLSPISPSFSPAFLLLLFRSIILYGAAYPWCPWRKTMKIYWILRGTLAYHWWQWRAINLWNRWPIGCMALSSARLLHRTKVTFQR